MSTFIYPSNVSMYTQELVPKLLELNSIVSSQEDALLVTEDENVYSLDSAIAEDSIQIKISFTKDDVETFIIDEGVTLEDAIEVSLGTYQPSIDVESVSFLGYVLDRPHLCFNNIELKQEGFSIYTEIYSDVEFEVSPYTSTLMSLKSDFGLVSGFTMESLVKNSEHFGEAFWRENIYVSMEGEDEYFIHGNYDYGKIIDLSSTVVKIDDVWENITQLLYPEHVSFANVLNIFGAIIPEATVPIVIDSNPVDIILNETPSFGVRLYYAYEPEVQKGDIVSTVPLGFTKTLTEMNEIVKFSSSIAGTRTFEPVVMGPFYLAISGESTSVSSTFVPIPTGFDLRLSGFGEESYISAGLVSSSVGAVVLFPHTRYDHTSSFDLRVMIRPYVEWEPFPVYTPPQIFEKYEYDGETIDGTQSVSVSGVLSIREGGGRIYPVGLYRDMFVGSTNNVSPQLVAHLPSSLGSFITEQTKFWSIEAGVKHEVFNMDEYSYGPWNVNIDVGIIAPFRTPMLPINLSPYLRISKPSTGEFIAIGVGANGGVVLHMHKKDFLSYYDESYAYDGEVNDNIEKRLVDPILGSTAALDISLSRYQRHARVLYGVSIGEMWDEVYIDAAVKYLVEKEQTTMVYEDVPYSPTVVASLIRNLSHGLINKDLFDAPVIRSHKIYEDPNGDTSLDRFVSYIYEDVDEIADGECVFRYIRGDKAVVVTNEDSPKSTNVESLVFKISPFNLTSAIVFCDDDGCTPFTISEAISDALFSFDVPNALIGICEKTDYPQKEEKEIPEFGLVSFDSVVESGTKIIISTIRSYLSVGSGSMSYRVEIPTPYKSVGVDGYLSDGMIDPEPVGFGGRIQSLYLDVKEVYAKRAVYVTTSHVVFDPTESSTPVSEFSMGRGLEVLGGVSTEYSTVWVKVFPRNNSDTATIESDMLRFYVTERVFALNMFFPYKYTEFEAKSNSGASKSGSSDIKEKKIFETDDPFKSETLAPLKPLDEVCGSQRTNTYLNFQGHSHMFAPGDNTLFGNYSWEEKQLFMSGFVVELERIVTRKGSVLRDADALKRTLTELTLSKVEELSVVENWHIEDFELNAEDVGLEANDGEAFADIDDAFRAALKAAVSRLGEDGQTIEQDNGENMFPSFPEREVVSDELATDKKVQQFFVVQEEEE